jgi:hypothetical protein
LRAVVDGCTVNNGGRDMARRRRAVEHAEEERLKTTLLLA